MAKKPIVFKTEQRVPFSDLDPYHHVGTAVYARYFIDHRMNGLRQAVGWDLAALYGLPFMIWVRRLEIDFISPAVGDQALTITSFVREFRGPDAFIECAMADRAGKDLSRCLMVVACVDKRTNRSVDWPADAMALFFEHE